MASNPTKKRHYERVIVACAFLLLFVNVGFTSTSFSVYQPYIVDMPGVGNVGGSLVVTVRTLVALVCMFFTEVYFKRLNPRIGFLAATLCTCMAFAMFAFVENLPGLCVASVLAGIGYGLGGMVAATYLIGNWFHGKVGSVSGVVTMGSGLAAIAVPACAGWLIEDFSLQTSFIAEAAAALVIGLLVFAFVRMRPEDAGMHAVEDANGGKAGSGAAPDPKESHKPRRRPPHLPRHPKLRLAEVKMPKAGHIALVVAIVLLGGVSLCGYNYFGILLTTQGIDPMVAASLISLAGVFLTASKFLVGVVCDKFGTLIGSAVFFGLLILSMVLCSIIGAGGVPEAALAAIVLGIGMPLGTTGVSLWSLELATQEQMAKTVKNFQVAFAFGGFAFNMMPGTLAQATGTYTTTYMVLAAMSVVCAAIVLTVYARHILRARRAYRERLQ